MKKKVLSIFLAVCFVFMLLPFGAYAATYTGGTCGKNLEWTLKGTTLTIFGNGAMSNYDWDAPWSEKCESIVNIVIKDGVTSIGNSAFASCFNLKNITIADSVQKIGSEAFQYSNVLTSITLPTSLKSIGQNAFYGCIGLQDVNYSGTMAQWKKVKVAADEALISAAIIHCTDGDMDNHSGTCGSNINWDITDGILTISGKGEMMGYDEGEYAPWRYRTNSITSVVINNGITVIGSAAFMGCNKVTSVSIPASVKSIEYEAFYGCESLETIELPGTLKTIGDVAFLGCGFKDLVVPEGVESIGYLAFTLCDKLETASIPSSVKKIGWAPFKGCKSLKSITVAKKNKIYFSSNGILLEKSGLNIVAYPEARELSASSPALKVTTANGKPKLSWNKIDGAAEYIIYRSTDGVRFNFYNGTENTSYTDKNAKAGTKYSYIVEAVNEYTEALDYSAIKNVQCKPAAPTVSISRSGGKAKLSWKAVSGATKYYVYRSTDGVKYKPYYTVSKTSFTDSKSASGKKYYYKVRAVTVVNGKAIVSDYSNVKSIFTSLAKPTVKITTVSGKPKLSWGKVTGADKYYVYRSTNGKNYTLLIKTTKTSVTNTGAKKGTKYYYKVKAICSANTNANSAFSTVVSIKATK